MNKQTRRFSFLWLLLIMLMPILVSAKNNMGTINIKVGETYYVSHGYDNSYYTVSGSWFRTDGNAFAITGSNSGNGKCEIKGMQVGTSTLNWTGYVYASGSGWDVEAYWTVNVTEDPVIKVSSITLNTNSLSLKVRQEETLTATVWPSDASDKSVSWSTDNADVATVSPLGTVKAKAEGSAIITCKANDGSGVYATCTIIVKGELPESETGTIKQIAAGSSHTMILMSDGTLWACGENDKGQLCDGTTTNCNKAKRVMTDVAYVAAGGGHTMIVKEDGSLWACGWNEYGQLGDGTYTDCSIPKQVMTDVASVSAGTWHTLILKSDGSLWACGYNKHGELGDGTQINKNRPRQIMSGVVTMAAGQTHTLIVKNDGSLWSCGLDNNGELAGGPFFSGSYATVTEPKQAMTGVKAVAAGASYSMIIKQDNSLWTCGEESYGCLGVGSKNIYFNTEQIMTGVKAVSARYYHTLILKTDGTLFACGWNYSGQLGDGTTTNSSTPKQVMTEVASVAAGSNHTVIQKKDGSLWACGGNKYGQLGDGTNTDRYTPVEISIDILVTNITLNKSSLTLQEGQEEKLEATISPSNAKDKSVTWTSSNTNVVTVDGNGTVLAKANGNATISCSANDGSGVEATCNVTVITRPESITLPASQTVKAGETITLTPTVTPANAEYALTWTSDDETVATVNSAGVVMGVKKGQTFINVETDNGKAAYCKLTVTAAEPTGIELPKNATVYVGGTLLLTPTITPEGAETTLTWKSDDETVLRVDATGVLTGLAEGLALVTVTTANGQTSNACKVKVEQDPSGISDVLVGARANFPVYTLSGQRLAAPRKGINIIGGRKVIVK